MGQAAMAVAAADQGFSCSKTCRHCGDMDREQNTVRVDLLDLQIPEDPVRMLNAPGPRSRERSPPPSSPGRPFSHGSDVEDMDNQEELTALEKEKARVFEEARQKLMADKQKYQLEQEKKLKQRLQEHHERQQLGEEKWREVKAAREEGASELQRRESLRHQLMEEHMQREHRRTKRHRTNSMKEEEEALKRRENFERKQKVNEFLEVHGFQNVKQIVRKRFTKVRPLHVAVQENNPEAVALLLWAGADKFAVCGSGKGETPMQLAQRLDKAGSHADILQVLSDNTGDAAAAAA